MNLIYIVLIITIVGAVFPKSLFRKLQLNTWMFDQTRYPKMFSGCDCSECGFNDPMYIDSTLGGNNLLACSCKSNCKKRDKPKEYINFLTSLRSNKYSIPYVNERYKCSNCHGQIDTNFNIF